MPSNKNNYQLLSWLKLQHTDGLGSVKIQKILQAFQNIEDFFEAPSSWRKKNSFPENLIVDEKGIEKDLHWLDSNPTHQIICLKDENYPIPLKHIFDPPPILYVKGSSETLLTSQIAMVGSRNPSPNGIEIAFSFSKDLFLQAGLTITSGLALGIDAASHKGVLSVKGKTIAVMGTGLDQIYPSQHDSLCQQIIQEGGCLVSEFSIGTPPFPKHFPRRNRIISGLSLGVIVIEAVLKSGSLVTARLANEQGREVFAVPGSIYNPNTKGCHALIKQGAKLTETIDDVLEELPPFQKAGSKGSVEQKELHKKQILGKIETGLLECIGFDPTPLDLIAARGASNMNLNIKEITATLFQLEMCGYLLNTQQGYVRIKKA